MLLPGRSQPGFVRMQGQAGQNGGLMSYLIPLIVIAVVMALRMRRMGKMRPLKLETLWVVPALYAFVVAVLFFQHPPTALGWGLALAGFAGGCALGWQRGRLMEIHVDPETHALNQKASLASMLFLVGLIGVRTLARTLGSDMHLDIYLAIDTLAALALGMFTLMRVEMYLRAKRLLEEARASRAS